MPVQRRHGGFLNGVTVADSIVHRRQVGRDWSGLGGADPLVDRDGLAEASPGGGVTAAGPLFAINCSGQRAINAPKWTVNLGAQQVVPFEEDYQIVLDADTQYRSGRFVGFDYIPQEYVNHSWGSNASISIGAKNGRYVLGAFVRNIENNRVQVYGTPVPASNLIVSLNAAPRTYGLRLSTKF